MRPCRRLRTRDRDRGAEAVEFALILPVFIALISGVIYFGLILAAQISITQAARDGARYAAICNTNTTCLGAANANVAARTVAGGFGFAITAANVTATACTAPTVANPVPSATVVVTYTVSLPAFPDFQIKGQATTPCGG